MKCQFWNFDRFFYTLKEVWYIISHAWHIIFCKYCLSICVDQISMTDVIQTSSFALKHFILYKWINVIFSRKLFLRYWVMCWKMLFSSVSKGSESSNYYFFLISTQVRIYKTSNRLCSGRTIKHYTNFSIILLAL